MNRRYDMILEISGIKCDTCTWRDDTVVFEDYPEYINKPCPICSNNLLTVKHYSNCLTAQDIIAFINRFRKYFMLEYYSRKLRCMYKKQKRHKQNERQLYV